MVNVPTLFYGFEPKVQKASRLLVQSVAASADTLRLTAPSISEVRAARDFLFTAPQDIKSSKRCLVIDIETVNERCCQALLRLFEEIPATAMVVLTAATISSVPSTILSRCALVQKHGGDYGARLKEYMDMGLSVSRASKVSDAVDLGLTQSVTPSASDASIADSLVDAIRTHNLELGLSVIPYGRAEASAAYTESLLVALRQSLLKANLWQLIPMTYSTASVTVTLTRCLGAGMKIHF